MVGNRKNGLRAYLTIGLVSDELMVKIVKTELDRLRGRVNPLITSYPVVRRLIS